MLDKIIQFSLKNRLLVLLATMVLIVCGLYTAFHAEVDVFPDLNAPTVVVMTEAQGMAADEVEKVVPHGLSSADSIQFIRDLVRKWAEDQVLYEKAEHNVRGDERIERLVANYRRSLILNQYEQQLILQKMDENITEEELQKFRDCVTPLYEKYCSEYMDIIQDIKGQGKESEK